jgi:hypothetical protein
VGSHPERFRRTPSACVVFEDLDERAWSPHACGDLAQRLLLELEGRRLRAVKSFGLGSAERAQTVPGVVGSLVLCVSRHACGVSWLATPGFFGRPSPMTSAGGARRQPPGGRPLSPLKPSCRFSSTAFGPRPSGSIA